MTTLSIHIETDDDAWTTASEITNYIEKSAQSAFDAVDKPDFFKDKKIEISVLLTNDAGIQQLNRDYRDNNKATNVLSFPQIDFDDLTSPMLQLEELPLGDIIFAYETIQKEAEEQRKSFSAHLSHLTVHGILHLFGFDHENDDEASVMESLECDILEKLGYKNPYIENNT